MSVHLQRVRLYVTTATAPNAGTDDPVALWVFAPMGALSLFPSGWHSFPLDHSWDDRVSGRTEMYEVAFPNESLSLSLSGATVPEGIGYSTWAEARSGSFFIRIGGNDLWQIDSYILIGAFHELEHVPGSIDSFRDIDHGWLLMARRDADVDLSTDPAEGGIWHHVALNGTFTGAP